MYGAIREHLAGELAGLKEKGLYKEERIITSPQGAEISVRDGDGTERRVINFCANNYLGLAGDPVMAAAASRAMEERGFGYASVRFICGTSDVHRELEMGLSRFLGTDDTILYAAAFDANGGVFEPLLGPEDAIVSDELNHASIIDGVRLCKAKRYRYRHGDPADLRRQLKGARREGARFCMIATDGVFSMDGDIAPLPQIVELAEEFDALVMVDDCHATGYLGPDGGGTPDYWGLRDRIDIVTGTLGKALGGASGGFVSGRREIVDMLRQRSRPYLFSNTLAPGIAVAAIHALEIVRNDRERRERPVALARRLRSQLAAAGFDLLPSETAIIAVMLYDEPTALTMASRLLEKGIYVIGFAYPVVPQGKARIRVQVSAAHREDQIDSAATAFAEVAREMKLID
jgi:glycine C-acetyltransferase